MTTLAMAKTLRDAPRGQDDREARGAAQGQPRGASRRRAGRPLRVMIAGGGTGGHLFPGVALAEQVLDQGGEVRFVGTDRGIEARVIPELGWTLDRIEVSGIKGRGLEGLISGLLRLPRAWLQSRRIIRSFDPDVVVGVGGYASGPIVATAWLMRRPTAILEQNSVPGITNRILGRLVRKVFATFPDSRGHFSKGKLVLAGNPIRAALVERLADARGRARGGAKGSTSAGAGAGPEAGRAPRLFVFGGSQGAQAINSAMIAAAAALVAAFPGVEIWHQTGERDLERVRQGYAAAGLSEPQVRVVPFIKDMTEPYAWCDLVLCRAGATSLAELSAVGCPALLVPFPHATDDHQTHNAAALVEAGAAVMLPERELEGTRLVSELEGMLAPGRPAAMRAAMLAAARPQAAAVILEHLQQLVG